MADDLYAFIPCLNAEGSEGFFKESCLPSLKVTGIVQLPPDSVKAPENKLKSLLRQSLNQVL